jgi:hypothetical protein
LDKALKAMNPASSCTSILLRNQTHSEKRLSTLPAHHKPHHIAHNYTDIEKFTYAAFNEQLIRAESITTGETKTSQVQKLDERAANTEHHTHRINR